MLLQIETVRSLELLNWRSSDRLVEVHLAGLPSHLPEEGLRRSLLVAFEKIQHPPDDAEWNQEFTDCLSSESSWIEVIAKLSTHLQRFIVRFNGAAYFEGHLGSTATLALECLEFEVGEACLRTAVKIVGELCKGRVDQLGSALEELSIVHEQFSFGSVTRHIVSAARHMGIPICRLDGQSLVQLGHGKHQRRIRRSCTDATGYVAELVSEDKALVKSLWAQIGIPVANGRVVEDAVDAVRAANDIGWPIVVKPSDADYGDGVSVGIKTEAGVRSAFGRAVLEGSQVMVERHMPGDSYRLLVIDQHVFSAVCRLPPIVVGDGRQNIEQLVELANRDPRRGPDRRWGLRKIKNESIEMDLLAEQGFNLASVPPAGTRVWLRRDIDIEEGGTNHEVLDSVHPTTLALACDAAQMIGIDLAGVDLIARDISRPLADQDGGFLEVNAEPGIGLHLSPLCDKPRPVGEAILSALFKNDRPIRIPLTLVLGDSIDFASIQLLAAGESIPLHAIAMSTRDQTIIDAIHLLPRTLSLAHRINAMIMHPRTAAAFAAAKWTELIECGIGVNHCELVILLDSGLRSIEESPWSREIMRSLMSRLLASCDRCVVNVDDPVLQELIVPGTKSLTMIATSKTNGAILSHEAAGGATLVLDSLPGDASLSELNSCFLNEAQRRHLYKLIAP